MRVKLVAGRLANWLSRRMWSEMYPPGLLDHDHHGCASPTGLCGPFGPSIRQRRHGRRQAPPPCAASKSPVSVSARRTIISSRSSRHVPISTCRPHRWLPLCARRTGSLVPSRTATTSARRAGPRVTIFRVLIRSTSNSGRKRRPIDEALACAGRVLRPASLDRLSRDLRRVDLTRPHRARDRPARVFRPPPGSARRGLIDISIVPLFSGLVALARPARGEGIPLWLLFKPSALPSASAATLALECANRFCSWRGLSGPCPVCARGRSCGWVCSQDAEILATNGAIAVDFRGARHPVAARYRRIEMVDDSVRVGWRAGFRCGSCSSAGNDQRSSWATPQPLPP